MHLCVVELIDDVVLVDDVVVLVDDDVLVDDVMTNIKIKLFEISEYMEWLYVTW